jgi:cyclase
MTPDRWAATLEAKGAGEILLTSIDREGTWRGFDVRLTASVTSAVRVPVIAHGGCGSLAHMAEVVQQGGASAVAVGSLVVYQGQGLGVLVNFPERDELARCFGGAA